MKLELRSLSYAYGAQTVLRDVTVCIGQSQAMALIGPSGGGKSTLLRLLAGLLIPTTGEILIDDNRVPATEKALLPYRRHVGVVFQNFNLFPHLTVRQNIMLPLTTAHHQQEDEAAETAEGFLSRLGLESHRHHYPEQLSGGQRQRVAIARALAIRPRLLLLDEPTSALDPEMTAEVLGLIEELRAGGCPFVMITHSMGFAQRVSDHVLFLAQQQILEAGPSAEFFRSPQHELGRRFLQIVSATV